MHAEIVAKLRIHGIGRRAAEAAKASIRPDNKVSPDWLEIKETVEGDDLVIEVRVKELSKTRLGGLRNTVDELLSVIYALLKSIEETAKALKEPGAGATSAPGRDK